MKCPYDSHCEININTRHTCSYCRLAKCFANGMQKELIRCPRPKPNQTGQKRKPTDNPGQILSMARRQSDQLAQVRQEFQFFTKTYFYVQIFFSRVDSYIESPPIRSINLNCQSMESSFQSLPLL